MQEKIGLDKFCDLLSKINADFTDYILEDWESVEVGNVKLSKAPADRLATSQRACYSSNAIE